VATGLGRDVATLYRWAAVAEGFTEEAFGRLMSLRNANGEAITWQHVMELAGAPPGAREGLLPRLLSECLSSRRLAKIVRDAREGRVRDPRLTEKVAAVTAALRRDAEKWTRAAAKPKGVTRAALDKLSEEIDAHEELERVMREHRQSLYAARAAYRQALVDAGEPVEVPQIFGGPPPSLKKP
jgi:hypothetical protein